MPQLYITYYKTLRYFWTPLTPLFTHPFTIYIKIKEFMIPISIPFIIMNWNDKNIIGKIYFFKLIFVFYYSKGRGSDGLQNSRSSKITWLKYSAISNTYNMLWHISMLIFFQLFQTFGFIDPPSPLFRAFSHFENIAQNIYLNAVFIYLFF